MIEIQVLMTFSDFSEFFLRIISSGGGFTFHWVFFFSVGEVPQEEGIIFDGGRGRETLLWKPCFVR